MKYKILLTLLLISNHLFSQTINAEKLNSYFNYIESNNLGVGSVSIFKAGEEVYNRKFGQKNIQESYDRDTKYQVGSVTKLITATLIFKLIDKGRLKIDDQLSDYYPEIPNSKKITIKNLLEHTSGLGSYVVKDGEVWVTERVSEKEIFDLIKQQGVSFEPGEKVAYSNTAYYLLAKIVEKKYKKPFHEVVIKEVSTPLKLAHLASVKSNPKNIFKSYRFENNKWTEVKDIDFFNVIGVGDMVATSRELNMFINNLFNHKIISKASLGMLLPISGKEIWGRGIAIWDFDNVTFVGHGGDTLGSHAVLMYNRDSDISIAYNTNAEKIRKEEFIKNVIAILYGKAFDLPAVK